MSLYDERIKIGDQVQLEYTDYTVIVSVVSTPQGPGDLWQFQDANITLIAVNPYHHDFKGIKRLLVDDSATA